MPESFSPRHKVAFVIDTLGFQEILSIPIVSAAAKARGHTVALFEFSRNPKKACREIVSFAPDIVAYSISSNEAQRYLQINDTIKKSGKFFSLFGGPHPTYYPQFIEKDGVDAICTGEGDLCFPEFLDRFGTDAMYEVSNFSFKTPDGGYRKNPVAHLVEDQDSLPFPDRSQLYEKSYFMARNPIKMFMAARGCPYDCSYCFVHAFNSMYKGKGAIIRTKSVEYLIAEIKDVARKYPLKCIRFADDIFALERNWLEEFAEEYPGKVGLPFTCFLRPNVIKDEYAKLLKKAGCRSAYIAIECANEDIRRRIANRPISNDQIISACAHLKKHGIRVGTFNMVGLPDETERDILDTIDLNRRIGADYAEASIFQPYPGTSITEFCRTNGYLEDGAEQCEGEYAKSVLKGTPAFKQKVLVLHRLFTMMVDHPRIRRLVGLLSKASWMNGILTIASRFYYGINMHRRIYGSPIPWWLRLHGAWRFFLSKSRV